MGTSFRSPTSLASGCAVELAGAPQLVDVREKGRFLTAGPVAVEASAGADDRFGAAVANDERLTAAPAGLGRAVGEKWRDLVHGTAPVSSERLSAAPARASIRRTAGAPIPWSGRHRPRGRGTDPSSGGELGG